VIRGGRVRDTGIESYSSRMFFRRFIFGGVCKNRMTVGCLVRGALLSLKLRRAADVCFCINSGSDEKTRRKFT